MDPVVADAEIARLEAQFQHADEHLKRVEPLLPLQFVTTDNVEKARTERASALAALNEARARNRLPSPRWRPRALNTLLQRRRCDRPAVNGPAPRTVLVSTRVSMPESLRPRRRCIRLN